MMDSDKIVIRKCKLHDIPQIKDIYNYYILNTTITFEQELVSLREMESRMKDISCKYPYIVAVSNETIVGYAYAHQWKEKSAYSATLESTIYLSTEYQQKGIGTKLMQELISQCKAIGIHSLIACITAENTSSCTFHERLGFSKVSHFKEVGLKFNRHLDIIDYQLIIK